MKNKLLRKAICLGLMMSMVTSTVPFTTARASENSVKEINTLPELEKTLDEITKDNVVTNTEKNELKNNLDAGIAQEYLALYNDEIKDAVNNKEGEKVDTIYEEETDTYISTYEYKVTDTISVKAKFVDEPEISSSLAKTTITSGGGPKELGDRKSTGEYEETILGISICDFKLTLGYTINKTNMTTRYSSTSGSASYGSLSTSSYITDSVAAEVGHDMNCIGDYTIDILGYATTSLSLELRVKWSSGTGSDTRYILYTMSKL